MLNNSQGGYTIIELMIVISMIGILFAVSFPTMKEWRRTNTLNSSAIEIKSFLETAKSHAVANQRNVAVSFTAGTGSAGQYRSFIDTGANAEVMDAGDQLYQSGQVGKDIVLSNPNFQGTVANATVFNFMGLSTGFSGTVQLANNDGSLFKRISVTNGGMIRIESSPSGLDGTWVE